MTTSNRTPAKHDDATESEPKGDHSSMPRRYSRRLLVTVIAGVIVLCMGLYAGLMHFYMGQTAVVGDRVIGIEVVSTSAARERGLSGRDGLLESRGMLFEFDTPGMYCFWMKDMRFPIDMIWLDGQKRVIKIQKNVEPETYPSNFCPQVPAQYVLEVAAGIADKAGLKEGDQVRTHSGLVL